jgi:excisionase family DNA binding protein
MTIQELQCAITEHPSTSDLKELRELRELRSDMNQIVRLNSIKDIVARTGLSRSTVYEEMDSGRLLSVKVGRRRLIPESALVDYIAGLVEEGIADRTAV